jgi:hypothetical protein
MSGVELRWQPSSVPDTRLQTPVIKGHSVEDREQLVHTSDQSDRTRSLPARSPLMELSSRARSYACSPEHALAKKVEVDLSEEYEETDSTKALVRAADSRWAEWWPNSHGLTPYKLLPDEWGHVEKLGVILSRDRCPLLLVRGTRWSRRDQCAQLFEITCHLARSQH